MDSQRINTYTCNISIFCNTPRVNIMYEDTCICRGSSWFIIYNLFSYYYPEHKFNTFHNVFTAHLHVTEDYYISTGKANKTFMYLFYYSIIPFV